MEGVSSGVVYPQWLFPHMGWLNTVAATENTLQANFGEFPFPRTPVNREGRL
jgi:hypothetical protein